jgi:5-methyltetrahydrofolate--homocysteine methyltransferase
VRVNRLGRRDAERLLPLEQARRNPVAVDWTAYAPPAPSFTGVRVFDAWPLEDLVPRIDWTPFFQTWELAGHYPAILDDPVVGEAARALWRDAQAMLDRIVRGRLLTARAVVGFWPANAVGDDVRLYADAARRERWAPCTSSGSSRPRGTAAELLPGRLRRAGRVGAARPLRGVRGHGGRRARRGGRRVRGAARRLLAILAKALADRLAEALAERLHERVRAELWGYAPGEALDNAALVREQYQGIRPAPGYPACPTTPRRGRCSPC